MPDLPSGPQGRILSTLRLVRDPRKWYGIWRERYGDPFLVHALNGDVVVTGQPDLIRQIYANRPENYDPFAVAPLRSLVGEHLILVLTGQAHARERKLLMPPFHGERMRAYGHVMAEVAQQHIERGMTREPFVALDVMNGISLEIIVRAVFGVEEDDAVQGFCNAILQFVEAMHPALFFSKALHRSFGGFGPWARLQPVAEHTDGLIFAELERRRSLDLEAREDILSLMMTARYEDGTAMSDAQLRDELMALLFAGHETTALALSWALYHLHRHPDVLRKLRDELSAHEDAEPEALARLPYLKAVCNETLRLHPIVPDVVRILREPMQLGDYRLPAGMGVGAATCLVHDDPEHYPQPYTFDPERFVDQRYRPYVFMPFGGGHRRCIGAAFASFEMAQVHAAILRSGTFEPRDVLPVRRNITMGPSTGVGMRRVS